MIRRTASAVYLLRDAFTGVTLTDGAATRCFLDGRPLRRPIWKREGYLVLTDLPAGSHVVQFSRSGYRDESVELFVADGSTVEDTITLKPGAGYRFPRETVRVSLTLLRGKSPAAGEHIWLGTALHTPLKLAQEKVTGGDEEAHLFCEGKTAQLPIPGHFLLADKNAPELTYLRSLRNEKGEFAPPLAQTHSRGTELIPMQSYGADDAGALQVLLREPGTLVGYYEGKVFEAPLRTGEQSLEWKLEG